MKYIVLLLLFAMQTHVANAEIYKCKQKDGSIEYSMVACSPEMLSEEITTIRKKKSPEPLIPKTPVPFDEIKTASDALSNLRLDGFAMYSLRSLRKQLEEGKGVNRKINFLDHESWAELALEISFHNSLDSKSGNIYLWVSGMNYEIYDNPAEERLMNGKDTEVFFDVTMASVNRHAKSMGLGKGRIYPLDNLHWEWEQDGFKCELTASIHRNLTPHDVIYSCNITLENKASLSGTN